MGVARITLFDFDVVSGQMKEPIVSELEYNPNIDFVKKVSIYVGDDICGGQVMIPLDFLTGLMARVMQLDEQRASKIIVPNKEIILPH